MKGQSGSSLFTFAVLSHMYVPDILHDYNLLTLGQPVLALDDFGLSLPALGLISERILPNWLAKQVTL